MQRTHESRACSFSTDPTQPRLVLAPGTDCATAINIPRSMYSREGGEARHTHIATANAATRRARNPRACVVRMRG